MAWEPGCRSPHVGGSSAREALDTLGSEPTLPDFVGWYHLARARALSKTDPIEDGLKAFDEAKAAFRTLSPGRYELAFALLEQARVVARAGSEPAHELLNECINLARDIHARWIEAQALLLRSRLAAGGETA